jgi:hypothetical protein
VIKQQTRPRKGTPPYLEMIESADGKIILTPDEHIQALQMAHSVNNNAVAKTLINDCKIEQSLYFTHALTGIQCKVRPDAWFKNIVIDLKTSGDASFKAFQSSCMNYGYFLQAGMIKEALSSINIELEEFVFIVVEKQAPFAVAIYNMSEEALQYGVKLFDDLLMGLKHCMDGNVWPAYPMKLLTVPGWVKYDSDMEIE